MGHFPKSPKNAIKSCTKKVTPYPLPFQMAASPLQQINVEISKLLLAAFSFTLEKYLLRPSLPFHVIEWLVTWNKLLA